MLCAACTAHHRECGGAHMLPTGGASLACGCGIGVERRLTVSGVDDGLLQHDPRVCQYACNLILQPASNGGGKSSEYRANEVSNVYVNVTSRACFLAWPAARRARQCSWAPAVQFGSAEAGLTAGARRPSLEELAGEVSANNPLSLGAPHRSHLFEEETCSVMTCLAARC